MEPEVWTCDVTRSMCLSEVKLFEQALQAAQGPLHESLVQQSNLKAKPLDLDWLACGEVSYHHDEYYANELLYFFWVTHLSEPALFVIDGIKCEVHVGDWFVFDAYNLHAMRKKNPRSFDSPPLQMIFGLGTIDLSIAWRKRMGIRVRPLGMHSNLAYPDYCGETGMVLDNVK